MMAGLLDEGACDLDAAGLQGDGRGQDRRMGFGADLDHR